MAASETPLEGAWDRPSRPPPRGREAPRPGRLGRRFWSLWSAGTVSSLGDGLTQVALPLLAADLTRRPLLIAAVAVLDRLPTFLVGLPAGAYADRVDRRRLLRQVDLARAGLMGALAAVVAVGVVNLPVLYGFAVVLGALEPFSFGATQALLPALVPSSELPRANGLLYAGTATTEHTIGPAIGGVVYSLARVVPFGADAASFLGSSALLLGLGRDAGPTGPRPGRRGLARHLVADVRAGLSWYRRSRVLGLLSATVATLALTQAMVSAILVLFALEDLHLSTTGYGVFMGVFAVGNVLGGVLANRALRVLGTARVVALAALLSGLGYLVAGTLSSPFAAAGVLAVVALAVVCGNVATVSFRQATVPPALQARVATVWRAVVWAALPLGSLLGGVLAAALGLRVPFFVAGGAQALLAVIVAGPLARLIKAASAAPEPAAGATRPGRR